jgi:flavorubredoxin
MSNDVTPTPPAVPAVAPHRIASDAWLIPNLAPAGPGVFLPVNTMVIRGEQPMVVDTGAPVHRDRWFEQVFSLVDPDDVRWIYISHDDGDHVGNLHELLELAPKATLVVNFFITERLALERALPLDRMVWLGPGDTLDIGDRALRLIVPPIFDGPTTRALFDERSEVLWAVDSFGADDGRRPRDRRAARRAL